MTEEEKVPDICFEIPKELQDLWDRMESMPVEKFPEINFDVPELEYDLPEIPSLDAEYARMEAVMDAYIARLAGGR